MALAALLSSLALLASSPSALQLAQNDQPAAAAPVGRDSNLEASADAIANGEDPFPAGAPSDDYGFMAWCYGALAGHLDLYDKVLPDVKEIEARFPDPDTPMDKVMDSYRSQHAAGMKMLDGYGRALTVMEATGKPAEGRAAAVTKGRDVWKGSEGAKPRELAQLWMSWALPARCQTTADRLVGASATR